MRTQKEIKVYAAMHTCIEERRQSSSGGAFYAIASWFIEKKKGIVVGVVLDKMRVKHAFATTTADLQAMRGSKYVQSFLGNTFIVVREKLDAGLYILFSGTPCEVNALKRFLKRDYENLFTIDIVCHGVPKASFFEKSVSVIEKRLGESIVNYEFRSNQIWGDFSSVVYTQKGRKVALSSKYNYYMKAFLSNLSYCEKCYGCKFSSTNREGDITLADFWGIGIDEPFEIDETPGVSLLLVNTEKGDWLVDQVDSLLLMPRSIGEATAKNPNLVGSSSRPPNQRTFYSDLELMSHEKFCKKYALIDKRCGFKQKIGTILNIMRGFQI